LKDPAKSFVCPSSRSPFDPGLNKKESGVVEVGAVPYPTQNRHQPLARRLRPIVYYAIGLSVLDHSYSASPRLYHKSDDRNMRFSTLTLWAAVVGGWDTTAAFVPVVRHPTVANVLGSTALNAAEPSASAQSPPRTLYDKIWDDHLVDDDGMSCLMYVDRHLVHEVTSPQAFEGLRLARRGVRRPDCTLVTVDHNVPTSDRQQLIDVPTFIQETASRTQVLQLETNVKDFGLKYFSFADERQGIVHIIGPEQGFTLPGCVTVCGDSHTATHGAFGALAFGIGTSEVEHVLATQVRLQRMFMACVFVLMSKLAMLSVHFARVLTDHAPFSCIL
jgi:Aconitase family (aconitate hydratase)